MHFRLQYASDRSSWRHSLNILCGALQTTEWTHENSIGWNPLRYVSLAASTLSLSPLSSSTRWHFCRASALVCTHSVRIADHYFRNSDFLCWNFVSYVSRRNIALNTIATCSTWALTGLSCNRKNIYSSAIIIIIHFCTAISPSLSRILHRIGSLFT